MVPSSSDPRQLFVYLVNHRQPLEGQDAQAVGADSCIEIFKTILGSDVLEYIQTVEHPLILTPNDIAGSPDGKSFHFVNDHDTKLVRARLFCVSPICTTYLKHFLAPTVRTLPSLLWLRWLLPCRGRMQNRDIQFTRSQWHRTVSLQQHFLYL